MVALPIVSDQPPEARPAAVARFGAQARRRADAPGLLMMAAFGILIVLQIAHHDMWRDEIHSWGLVLASSSLSELFANLKFTGHPGLWYLILWVASFFTDSPFTVQIVHAGIAIALIGMISLASPFSRLEKLLLLSSYFVLFEYTVISRGYGIGFLIALIYANVRATCPDRVFLCACLLGLLANTNMFAFVLSGAFAFEYAVEMLFRRGKAFVPALKELLAPSAVYLAFVTLAVATMWPSPDISWRTTGAPLTHALDPARFIFNIAANVEALVTIHPLVHWGASGQKANIFQVAGLPVLAVVFFYIFRRHRQLLLIPGLTFAGSLAIDQLVYATTIRHWGVNFIAFVAALWIRDEWSPMRSRLALGLLAISAASGIAVSVQQATLTFSEGRATAEWIRENEPTDVALVGTPDAQVSTVAQYLGKPIYFLDCSCIDTYLVYSKRRDAFDPSQIPDRLARAVAELKGRPILFLITHRLDDAELSALRDHGITLKHRVDFDQTIRDEKYFIYRVAAANDENDAIAGALSELRGSP